jgi:SAM-dependent methyltransferase
MSKGAIWSPYNKITTAQMKMEQKPHRIVLDFEKKDRSKKLSNLPIEIGLNVFIGNVFYQYILDLSNESVSQRPYLKPFQNQYNYPYTLASSLNDVLIVGAGTGNDVAGALRFGAKNIDAVEIDPSLVNIGKSLHPEKPYSKPQVAVYIDDARSFMKKSKKNYDLIIFGQLDSHQIFSSMSNVRLDSYVYTVESFREVKRLLKDNGIVIVSFALGSKVIVERMYEIMKQSFDIVGISFPNQLHPIGVQFLAGKNHFPSLVKGDSYAYLIANKQNPVSISTDNWPFFYVTEKSIPSEYLMFIVLAILISLSMVFPIVKGEKWDFHFLFLGSGFMLLETKSITSLALLYGSTWIVNSIVIAFILLMILLANLFVICFKPQNRNLFYGLLFVSIIISYFVPINSFLNMSFWPRLLLSSIFFSCPILMAGLIFAISFRDNKQSNLALAFNLIGIVVGGLCEYTVLVAGFRYLIILTMSLYFASFVFSLRQKV